MEQFYQLVDAVQDDLNVDDNSTKYPVLLIKRAINRAYRSKVCALFDWPELEDAKKTSTVAGQEYYDYPSNWRSDTAGRLEVDGYQYGEYPDGSPMDWNDYLTWRADSSTANSTDKKWATQKRRYFIFPVPTTNGTNNICIWGQMVPTSLENDGDATIFSYSMPEGNEAIVLEAVAILKSKGEKEDAGQFRSTEAKQILIGAWAKVVKNQGKFEKIQPFFDVPDYYASNNEASRNRIGRF